MKERVLRFFREKNIQHAEDLPLSPLTSFKIGGRAELAVFPKTISEVVFVETISRMENLPLKVFSGGSNLLVDDGVIFGIVMILKDNFGQISFEGRKMIVAAGVSSGRIISECGRRGLSGFENFVGVPSRIGGMMKMNFGAFGKEVFDFLVSALVIEKGELLCRDKKSLSHSYRESGIAEDSIIVGGEFEFDEGDKKDISDRLNFCIERRRATQPLGERSAGCVFKMTELGSAGYLIDKAGLKGHSVGGAEVSKKHAGYILNRDGATAEDVKKLIDNIKEKVYNIFCVDLKCELKVLENERK